MPVGNITEQNNMNYMFSSVLIHMLQSTYNCHLKTITFHGVFP